jgi:hypothetical protein
MCDYKLKFYYLIVFYYYFCIAFMFFKNNQLIRSSKPTKYQIIYPLNNKLTNIPMRENKFIYCGSICHLIVLT